MTENAPAPRRRDRRLAESGAQGGAPMTGQTPVVESQASATGGAPAPAFPSRRQMRAATSYQEDMSFQPVQPTTSAPLPSRRSRDNTLPDTGAVPVASRPQTIIRPPAHTGSIRAVTATGELSLPQPTDGTGAAVPPVPKEPPVPQQTPAPGQAYGPMGYVPPPTPPRRVSASASAPDVAARAASVAPGRSAAVAPADEQPAFPPRVARRSAVRQPGEALDPSEWAAGEIPTGSLPTVLSEVADLLSGSRAGAMAASNGQPQVEQPPRVEPPRVEPPRRAEAPAVAPPTATAEPPVVIEPDVAEETSIRSERRRRADRPAAVEPAVVEPAVVEPAASAETPPPHVPTRKSATRRASAGEQKTSAEPRVIDPLEKPPSWQEAAFGETTGEDEASAADTSLAPTRRRGGSDSAPGRPRWRTVLFVLLILAVFFVLGVVAWLLSERGGDRGAAMAPYTALSEGYSKYIDL